MVKLVCDGEDCSFLTFAWGTWWQKKNDHKDEEDKSLVNSFKMCKNALKSDYFIGLFSVVSLPIVSEYLKPLDSYLILYLVLSLEIPMPALFSSEVPVKHCL